MPPERQSLLRHKAGARFWIAYEARDISPALWRAPVIITEAWRADLFRPDAAWDLHGPFVLDPSCEDVAA